MIVLGCYIHVMSCLRLFCHIRSSSCCYLQHIDIQCLYRAAAILQLSSQDGRTSHNVALQKPRMRQFFFPSLQQSADFYPKELVRAAFNFSPRLTVRVLIDRHSSWLKDGDHHCPMNPKCYFFWVSAGYLWSYSWDEKEAHSISHTVARHQAQNQPKRNGKKLIWFNCVQ